MELNLDFSKKETQKYDLYKKFIVNHTNKYEELEFYEEINRNQYNNLKNLHNENFTIMGLYYEIIIIEKNKYLLLSVDSDIFYLVKVALLYINC